MPIDQTIEMMVHAEQKNMISAPRVMTLHRPAAGLEIKRRRASLLQVRSYAPRALPVKPP
jgi:hypothetical protein